MKVNWILALLTAILTGLGSAQVQAQSRAQIISDELDAEFASYGAEQSECGCDSKGSSKGGCDSCGPSPWRMFGGDGNCWEVGGWLAVGATANADKPRSRINGPVTFNDRSTIQANQMYMTLSRAADTGGCGTAWGGQIDLMYGTDYIFTQSAGLETHDDFSRHWNRSGNQYGIALPQVYAEVGINDLSIKLGHFYTIIGNEVVTAPDNFFYSHAYTMQYGEPFTHTGGLGSWNYNDCWTFHGGLVNGWDKTDAETDVTSVIGGATYTPDHSDYSVALAFISGDEDGTTGNTTHTRSMYSVVFSWNVTDNFTYIFQHDNGWNDYDAANVLNDEWYGINQYFIYTLNDCWALGARAEWFRDDDGSRLSSAPIRPGGFGGLGLPVPASTDFAGNYYNVTLGLNWTPTTNITVRPEVRWDWSDGTVIRPFDDLTKDSQFTAAFDAIWTF